MKHIPQVKGLQRLSRRTVDTRRSEGPQSAGRKPPWMKRFFRAKINCLKKTAFFRNPVSYI
ncbi:MAG: hypothetical protein QMC87_05485 [Methanothermobacter thermautotrophicus]|nr:hypothetical protein [Methanothermobacter thermautotrophicus]